MDMQKIFLVGIVIILSFVLIMRYKSIVSCPNENTSNFPLPNNSWHNEKPRPERERPEPEKPKPEPEKEKPGGLTAQTYDEALEKAKQNNMPVLFLIGAAYCPYCVEMERSIIGNGKDIAPAPEAKKAMDQYIVCHVDSGTDEGSGITSKFGIQQLPAFVIVDKNGTVLKHDEKSMSLDMFVQWLDNPQFFNQQGEQPGQPKQQIPGRYILGHRPWVPR